MQLAILPIFLLLTSVIANGGPAISAILDDLNAELVALKDKAASWSGDIESFSPMLLQSASILTALNKGTETAQSSSGFTILEGVEIYSKSLLLVSNLQATLSTIIDGKAKAERLGLKPTILQILLTQKEAADEFVDAAIKKGPAAMLSLGKNIVDPLDKAFNNAISEYR